MKKKIGDDNTKNKNAKVEYIVTPIMNLISAADSNVTFETVKKKSDEANDDEFDASDKCPAKVGISGGRYLLFTSHICFIVLYICVLTLITNNYRCNWRHQSNNEFTLSGYKLETNLLRFQCKRPQSL